MRSPLIFRIFKDKQLVGVKQFDQDQIVIGHSPDVNLNLDSDKVSPIHCLIEHRENGYYICDLGSQSGTFKNGQAILDEMIASGDEVVVGPFTIAFFIGVPKPKSVPGATLPPPPPAEDDKTVAIPVPPHTMPEQQAEMPPAAVVKTEEIKAAIPPVVPLIIPADIPKIEEVKVAKTAPPPPTQTSAPAPATPPPAKKEEPKLEVLPLMDVAPRVETPRAEPKVEVKQDEKPVIATPVMRPEIKAGKSPYKKDKSVKTFAPVSDVKDLKSYLKPGKGPVVQVLVSWKERILTTYNFKGTEPVRVNAGKEPIALPVGLTPPGFTLIETAGGMRVNTTIEMIVEMVSANGVQSIEEVARLGKAQRTGTGFSVKVEQGEMLCLTLPGGNLTLFVRYVAQPPVVPVAPAMLSSAEITGLVMSFVLVSVLALYIYATTPKDFEENKQEDVQRIAQVVFNKPTPPPEKPKPTPPPEVKAPPPPPPKTPPPQKVVVADMNKDAQTKGPKAEPAKKAAVAAKAAEVAPKETKDKVKKFTSTRQGGAVKMGETAGANAKSANKDVTKVGLFSAFGGGGNRKKIDQAYSGSGEVLGMADKATGTSGFNENRAGDDLGSKFKDSGAGGKGTATQGIAGVGTKGRASGQSAYGASEGFGGKSSVAISGGGMEESFDGTIDKEAIRRVIRAKLHEVKSCYERVLNTLEKGRKLEGKIVLGWEIVAKGQARNVKVKSSSMNNPQVENCIRDRLASWTFPEPPEGLVAEVQAYPFVLNQQ